MHARLEYPAAETALVVVDAQADLLGEDALGSDLVAEHSKRAESLATLGHLIAGLRDHGMRIVFANHGPISGVTSERLTAAQRVTAERRLFTTGTPGAELVLPALAREEDVFASAHTGLSAFSGTDLSAQLDAAGICRVVVAGAVTETTVDATARSAVELGLQVTVAADACISSRSALDDTHLRLTLPRVVHAVFSTNEILRRADTTSLRTDAS